MRPNNISLRILAVVFLMAFLNPFQARGQERLVESYTAAVWFGVRDVNRDSFPNSENLDFLNYLYSDSEMSDYQYLGLSLHLILRGNWEADIKFAMYDDFAPNNFSFAAQYFPFKHIGFNAGFYSYPQLMNEFNMFHRLEDAGYYGDIDNNFRQRYVYESGIMAGPVFRFDYNSFHALIKLNGGMSSISTFKEKVNQKEINTNKRREIRYSTKASPALFFFPEAEFNIDIYKGAKTTVGLQAMASWYTVNRSIDYTRVTYTWGYDDEVNEDITNPKHGFKKVEAALGLYFRW